MGTSIKTMQRAIVGLGIIATAFALTTVTGAEAQTAAPTTTTPAKPGADKKAPAGPTATPAGAGDAGVVLGKLHHSNQMEIKMGQLAQQKGASKDVKDFGKTLVKDHTAADKKVVALAKELKVELKTMPPMKDDKMESLKTQKGADFDKEFAAAMLDDHKRDVAEASSARDATTDPKLKSLLTETVPVLEKHQEIAQKLVSTLGTRASAP